VEVTKKVKKLYLLLAKKLRRKKYHIFLLGGIFFSWILISVSTYSYLFAKGKNSVAVLGAAVSKFGTIKDIALISPVAEVTVYPTNTPTPTLSPTTTPTPTPFPTQKPKPLPTKTPSPVVQNSQYTAQKINDVTWKVSNVSNDDKMASSQDIVNALNSYRGALGRSNLIVDGYLSSYAQERANLFAKNGGLDSHAGFQSFMSNGGFDKAGFNSLGENSAYLSGPMNGERIIKNIFGADSSHDGNQLSNWTHVGIGVNGVAVNVNFGKNKK
jgi:uncharacterized protein YkwD